MNKRCASLTLISAALLASSAAAKDWPVKKPGLIETDFDRQPCSRWIAIRDVVKADPKAVDQVDRDYTIFIDGVFAGANALKNTATGKTVESWDIRKAVLETCRATPQMPLIQAVGMTYDELSRLRR